jgi:hypothetical protein
VSRFNNVPAASLYWFAITRQLYDNDPVQALDAKVGVRDSLCILEETRSDFQLNRSIFILLVPIGRFWIESGDRKWKLCVHSV